MSATKFSNVFTDVFTDVNIELATLAERARQSTVKVISGTGGVGSGVIWRSPLTVPQPQGEDTQDGSLIITNAHVATAKRVNVELWDGRIFTGDRIAIDPTKDLAALKVVADNLPPATIGNSNTLRVGELVFAVGNPLGEHNAVTVGTIHAHNRQAVMADINLLPGNSGGMLADCFGRIVGINTMIVNGLGVAIPTHLVEQFLSGIIAGKMPSPPKLGITSKPVILSVGRQLILGLLIYLTFPVKSPLQAANLHIGRVILTNLATVPGYQ